MDPVHKSIATERQHQRLVPGAWFSAKPGISQQADFPSLRIYFAHGHDVGSCLTSQFALLDMDE